eukprot:6130057-Ditylum_brightwellii.AAC.1
MVRVALEEHTLSVTAYDRVAILLPPRCSRSQLWFPSKHAYLAYPIRMAISSGRANPPVPPP